MKMLVSCWRPVVGSLLSVMALSTLCSMLTPCSAQLMAPYGAVMSHQHLCAIPDDPMTCARKGCLFGTDTMGCQFCFCSLHGCPICPFDCYKPLLVGAATPACPECAMGCPNMFY